jgi:hypothetical protein
MTTTHDLISDVISQVKVVDNNAASRLSRAELAECQDVG